MTDKELMQQALDALESSRVFVTTREKIKHPEGTEWYDERIEALRTALSEPEQQPVAWMHTTATGEVYFRKKPQDKVFNPQPVYTTPPQREWQVLTDEEIFEAENSVPDEVISDRDWCVYFARAIEAKLKEKNT